MTEIPTVVRPRHADYVFLTVVCACIILLVILAASAVSILQRQLAPSDAFLFGETPVGSIMVALPTVLLSIAAAAALSKYIADRIRHLLKMKPADPLPIPVWAPAWVTSTNWRRIGAISVALLAVIAGMGLGSYFFVTERGLSVRPPLEFALRHYRWEDVAAVSMRCRSASRGRGFRYALRMSDGYYIDFRRVPTQRFDEAFGRIASRLDSVSGVRYDFDISEEALVALGSKHGAAGLENAIRSQVLKHGGVVQR